MRTAAAGARFLREAVVPQAELTSMTKLNAAARLAALGGVSAGVRSTGIRPESTAAAPARSRKCPSLHARAKNLRRELAAGSFSG
jgi:hypothetical protein